MTDKTPDHPFDLIECQKLIRHDHPYTPPVGVASRCPNGHRGFKIRLGGPLPLQVSCTTCAQANRTATAYEKGRSDAIKS
jgi:hypothetical protein